MIGLRYLRLCKYESGFELLIICTGPSVHLELNIGRGHHRPPPDLEDLSVYGFFNRLHLRFDLLHDLRSVSNHVFVDG